jgi:hypothetical protein
MCEVELAAVEVQVSEAAHAGQLPEKAGVDAEAAIAELHAGVLRASHVQAVEDEIENLSGVDKVAASGHALQVDEQPVDALEAGSHVFDGPEVRDVKVGEVAARIRGRHDDVLD